jgi:hypothetical protein
MCPRDVEEWFAFQRLPMLCIRNIVRFKGGWHHSRETRVNNKLAMLDARLDNLSRANADCEADLRICPDPQCSHRSCQKV